VHTLGHRRYPIAAEHTPITHHLSPFYQLAENPRFVDKKHINSYQSKSSFRLKKSILIGTNQNHRFVEKKNILIVTNQNHRLKKAAMQKNGGSHNLQGTPFLFRYL
jgi:hypothetical protein